MYLVLVYDGANHLTFFQTQVFSNLNEDPFWRLDSRGYPKIPMNVPSGESMLVNFLVSIHCIFLQLCFSSNFFLSLSRPLGFGFGQYF